MGITAINDDPTASGVPSVLTVTEDIASHLDLSAITVTDPDSTTNNITVKLAVSDGKLAVSDGGGVTVAGSDTDHMTLTGQVSKIDDFLDTAALNPAANIRYTGRADVNGVDAATLTITANDGGSIGTGGGTDATLGTVQINITPVNDAPSFVIRTTSLSTDRQPGGVSLAGGDQRVDDDAGAQRVVDWVQDVVVGPSTAADEIGLPQGLAFRLSTTATNLFSEQPWIEIVGTKGHLRYTPQAGVSGTATVFVELWDNGGTGTVAIAPANSTQPNDDLADDGSQNASRQSFDIEIGAFPDIVTLTPLPNTNNVPTEVYLELGFSQPMDTTSVRNSTLTLSEISAFGGAVVSNTQFDLDLDSDWISLDWHDTPRGADTLLKVKATTNSPPAGDTSFSLAVKKKRM